MFCLSDSNVNYILPNCTDNSVSPRLQRFNRQTSDVPFELRSDKEKEEIYEKIADQLAAIGDSYDLQSPQSPKALLLQEQLRLQGKDSETEELGAGRSTNCNL